MTEVYPSIAAMFVHVDEAFIATTVAPTWPPRLWHLNLQGLIW